MRRDDRHSLPTRTQSASPTELALTERENTYSATAKLSPKVVTERVDNVPGQLARSARARRKASIAV